MPEKQKGCRRTSRGTKDQLLIDKAVIKNCKRRKTNLNMAWIYFRKAYDMVLHSRMIKSLELVGAAKNIVNLLKETMKNWKTNLICSNAALGAKKITRDIFQGDSLSSLLFVVSLLPLTVVLRKMKQGYSFGKGKSKLNHLRFMDDLKLYGGRQPDIDSFIQTLYTVTDDIGMGFGIDKCGVLAIRRSKESECNGIRIGSGEVIGEVDDDDYKYLGIMERSDICQKQMKRSVKIEYFKRVRSALKSKLKAGNVVQAINIWAVPTVQYGARIIQWTREELQQMDRKTRKLITICGGLHSRSCVDRLYIRRSDGGRDLVSVED